MHVILTASHGRVGNAHVLYSSFIAPRVVRTLSQKTFTMYSNFEVQKSRGTVLFDLEFVFYTLSLYTHTFPLPYPILPLTCVSSPHVPHAQVYIAGDVCVGTGEPRRAPQVHAWQAVRGEEREAAVGTWRGCGGALTA